MEGVGLLFFIILVVASLIEQATKAGKQGKPGQGRPPQRPPGRRPAGDPAARRPSSRPLPGPTGGDRGGAVTADREELAAEMVAEDFWRELTGQPPRRRPVPAPAPPPEATSWDEEALASVEAPPPEVAPRREMPSWDYRRPEVVHEPPVIVSLESTAIEPVVRHDRLHRRLAQPASKPEAAAVPAARQHPLRQRLRAADTLRESIVLAEIFGRPRGLEDRLPGD